MSETTTVAILGAGVIGASWAALFLAAGHRVAIHDPSPDAETLARRYVESAWPVLTALGHAGGDPDALRFHADPAEAVAGAAFVQESVPERTAIKHPLYARIEPALAPGTPVASSASGLTLSELQAGWQDPAPLVLGHPFNPPHLIPLVEVMGNERTGAGMVERAEAVYRAAGKVTIRVRREVPGHVANRLQAALWREAIHLVTSGVASVEDVDTAVWAGPGLRWAAMGPTMLFGLGAGAGGLAEFCARYGDSFHRWWDDLGQPRLDAETARALAEGAAAEARGESPEALSARRDALILAMLQATAPLRSGEPRPSEPPAGG
ncbi:3-hydroxyacyl-CoA dehydrogenase NAD-binding domain-containing protein [Paralimibaculum aggregatum]|uniref:3-hydroxyacyl-CoA dehydrogenase NAD-binding domain-containing protein n=1 Tax=Paralimibaculum aggregatum TaxID=3036245 RepID=A0ABQ6LHJ0_9RHOB|nr:3-hydroxyacyl-CoA dehydrogenase NAD-binding domain-containing protein [Limibaculum sp. NKW23]GMG81695.1 3-hydroxyacyl-CoA dehydrogenase NAD-binding domain-containing protein [Limibaculum sp. NKW23]